VKKILLYTAFGLLVYLLALLGQLPASSGFALLQQIDPQWSATALNGSVFKGTAQQLRYRQQTLGDLDWHWQPSGLLRGGLAYALHLRAATTDLQSELMLSLPRELSLRNLRGQVTTQTLLRSLGQPPPSFTARLNPTGLNLALSTPQARLQAADGSVTVDQIVIAGLEPVDFGVLNIQLSTRQNAIHTTVQSTNSPVALVAEGVLSPTGEYQLTGSLSPRPSADESVRSLLPLLGSPAADGAYRLDLSGRLNY